MADEQAPLEGTPEPANTPESGTGTQEQQKAPSENWEERYKEAQAWGTRNAQRAAELEQQAQLVADLQSEDPVVQRQALEALGYTVPDDNETDTQPAYAELDPQTRARLDQFEAFHTQQQEQADYQQYRSIVDPQLEQMGVPKGLHDVLAEAALGIAPIQTPQGPQPNLKAAYEQLLEAWAPAFAELPQVQDKVKQSWAKSKPRAAFTSASGKEASQVPDLDKHENRVQYMLEKLQAEQM